VTYTAAEGRQQILDALGAAADEIAAALALLSEAYEHLDDHTAERLEEALFQPTQAAWSRQARPRGLRRALRSATPRIFDTFSSSSGKRYQGLDRRRG
jgi:hypothetical protein